MDETRAADTLPAANPQRLRTRLRWIGAVPLLGGVAVFAAIRLLGAVLPGDTLLWSLWGALAGVATFGRGHRLLRRSCTTALRRLSPITSRIRPDGRIHDTARDGFQELQRDTAALEAALRHRVFGLVPLTPPDTALHLLAALRRAQEGPNPVLDETALAEADRLKECFMRYVDTLA